MAEEGAVTGRDLTGVEERGMKLMVLTAALFPASQVKKKLWVFLASCSKYGIDPKMYGVGRDFPGYIYMKLDMQLEYLKGVKDYTHVLYTDSWDAFFTGPLKEIETKYETLGSPDMLVSAYSQLGNVGEPEKDYPGCFDESIQNRYPNVGGHLSKISVAIEMFERMLKLPRRTGDDCFSWYDAWQEGWFRPELDSDCEIFQVTDDDCRVGVVGRLHNTQTNSNPCILHLCGGYTDPETGKDDRLVPWAEKLGIL